MKRPRVDVAGIRREQIVEAAAAVIAEKGIQGLSLSEIESRAGMSRGQLTYYFPTKEEILLAVFDRVLLQMIEQFVERHGKTPPAGFWQKLGPALRGIAGAPQRLPEFHRLQYTFLSQIGHRADFRERLARLYAEWRGYIAADIAEEFEVYPPPRPVDPRTLATLIQAIFHGLAIQSAADEASVDGAAISQLFLDMLGIYLGGRPAPGSPSEPPKPSPHPTPGGSSPSTGPERASDA